MKKIYAIGSILVMSTLALTACSEGVGYTKKKCVPKGEDTLCVVATYLGEKKGSFVSTWEYFSPPPMFDVRVKSVSHTINVDCNAPEPATVTNLIVIDTEGNYVTLDATMKQQMMSGIQENEALKIAYETCE